MNVLIVQKFVENVQLFDKELVKSVDYSAHQTNSMSFNWILHLVDANRWYLLCILSGLNEDLCMQIIVVFRGIFAKVSQEMQNIDPTLQLLWRQMRWNYVNLKLLFGQITHVLVSLIIVRMESWHFVEGLAHVVFDLFFDTNLLLKQKYVAHAEIFGTIKDPLFIWVLLVQVWNHCLVNLKSDFILNLEANRLDDFFGKRLQYFSFVVVYSNVWLFKMLDVL